jgi:CBS domain-containing protein
MKLKTAGEMMIPLDRYPHMPYWFTLRQAIAEMQQSEFDIGGRKSLPRVVLVFNEEYQLLGIARRRDILRGLEPTYLSKTPLHTNGDAPSPNPAELSFDRLVAGVRERAERPIQDVLVPIQVTADVDDNIMVLINRMVDHNVHLLPVLKEGSVVGVIRTVEVFHEVGELVG